MRLRSVLLTARDLRAPPARSPHSVLTRCRRKCAEYVAVDTGVVALTNVLLIDGTGAHAAPGQTVVIRDGKIAEVGPASSVRPPAGAQVMDLAGHTLIPGIVGMHDHLFYTAAGGRAVQMSYTGPRLYLGSGRHHHPHHRRPVALCRDQSPAEHQPGRGARSPHPSDGTVPHGGRGWRQHGRGDLA